jgi:hypothetical protein
MIAVFFNVEGEPALIDIFHDLSTRNLDAHLPHDIDDALRGNIWVIVYEISSCSELVSFWVTSAFEVSGRKSTRCANIVAIIITKKTTAFFAFFKHFFLLKY